MHASGSIFVPLPPERALHYFTPVGERAWAPHWDPVFPAGEDGDGSAPGTVFVTGDTTWVVAARGDDRVRYTRVTPGRDAGTVEVRVRADGAGTRADVTYDMTALAAGDDPGHAPRIGEWEAAIAAAIERSGSGGDRSRDRA
jgi:Polyketide cyclase / dehydrase and lipid transport